MFNNICNGLTNFQSSGGPVCISDEISEEEYEEMRNNTYVTDDEIEEMCRQNEEDGDDEMYAVF